MRGVSIQTKIGISDKIAKPRKVRDVTSAMAKPSPHRTASARTARATVSGKWWNEEKIVRNPLSSSGTQAASTENFTQLS